MPVLNTQGVAGRGRASMRIGKLTLLTVVLVAVLAVGCNPVAKPTLLTDVTPIFGRDLLFLGLDGGRPLVLDLAQDDKLYTLGDEQAGLFGKVTPFSPVSLRANPADGALPLSVGISPTHRNVPVVKAPNHRAAAQAYPPALMDRFLFSSYLEDYAIAENHITSIKVLTSGISKVSVEFTVDLKPAGNPLRPAGSRWGAPGADGFVRGRRLVLDIYGHGGSYCTYRPDWPDHIFTSGAPPVAQTPHGRRSTGQPYTTTSGRRSARVRESSK